MNGIDSSLPPFPWWKRIFAVDLRSLALLRVALGVLVLLDVWIRWPLARSMYSDAGCFPRSLATTWYEQTTRAPARGLIWSIHSLSGSEAWVETLFVIEAVAAVLLILGLFSRVATLVCWFLVASMQTRNPLVVTSGDTLLKLMLMWSVFLPLARTGSLDSWLWQRLATPLRSMQYVSMASAGFILQFVLMYFFTGVAKCNDTWFSGQAMEFVWRLDIYANETGKKLLEYSWLPPLISHATLLAELFAVWLVLSPWKTAWFRMAVLVIYWMFHIGIAVSMSIGLFPWICMTAWLVLLPGGLWDRIGVPNVSGESLRQTGWGVGATWLRAGHWIAGAVCGVLIVITLLWNLANLDEGKRAWLLPYGLEKIGRIATMDQHFQMFGKPPRESPWFVCRAVLFDDREVDLYRKGEPVDIERSRNFQSVMPDLNWRKLHRNLMADKLRDFRQPLLDYAVRNWNESHPPEQQVRTAELTMISEPTGPDFNGVNRRTAIWGNWYAPGFEAGSRFNRLREQIEKGHRPRF